MRFKVTLLLFLICFPLIVLTQLQQRQFIKTLLDHLAENLPEDLDLSELEEQLLFFNVHPIDLNHTNENELKSLAFLNPLQISALFTHIQTHGKLIDMLELQQVEGFNHSTIRMLLPFVTVRILNVNEEINFHNLRHLGKHEVLLRAGTLLETPKGFDDLPGSRYLGSKEKILLKYRYTLANRVSIGFTLEKDAGEYPLWRNATFADFNSGHLAVSKLGKIEKLVLGDYSLQFGQGLNLWSGLAYGKSPDVASIATKDIGLKPYTSANEYAFFRGVAAKIKLTDKITSTVFASHRKLDANIDTDTMFNRTLSSINQTGLHRTPNEIENRHSLRQQLAGSVIEYQTDFFTIGAVCYHQKFNHSFVPGKEAYTAYRFSGNKLTNIGFNYHFNYKNTYFFGEFGKSSSGGVANLHGLLTSISNQLSAAFVYRRYARNYHNFYHQAMAEGGDATNESGFYAGLNFSPTKSVSFSFYVDRFQFPWLKFRIDAPSYGNECLLQLAYVPNKHFKTALRYKDQLKQQNTSAEVPIHFLEDVRKKLFTLSTTWQKNKAIRLENRLEFVHVQKAETASDVGYLICQDVGYSPMSSKLSGNIRLAYFYSTSYDSRMYAYEDDVLYAMGFGMYHGKGWRTYLNLKHRLFPPLTVWFRYALFLYPKAQKIGSGLDEINGHIKSDVKLQLRFQF